MSETNSALTDPLEELPAIDVDALLLRVEQLEGDLESWKAAMTILLAELVTYEMPFAKLDAVMEKTYAEVQNQMHYGYSSGRKGARIMTEPLVDKIVRAAAWRQMTREHKKGRQQKP